MVVEKGIFGHMTGVATWTVRSHIRLLLFSSRPPMAPASAVPSGHKDHATPRKDREKDRQPFPQSSHQSPAQIKLSSSSASTSVSVHSHSTSTSSLASSAAAPTPVITVDGVLRQHAAASDPKAAALDHVVAERNTLSSQNSQLWKLIEKQRAGYNQILKELERIRSERDSYKAKLAALSGGASSSSSSRPDHRTTKLSLAEPASSAYKSNGNSPYATPSRGNSTDEYREFLPILTPTPQNTQATVFSSWRTSPSISPFLSFTRTALSPK